MLLCNCQGSSTNWHLASTCFAQSIGKKKMACNKLWIARAIQQLQYLFLLTNWSASILMLKPERGLFQGIIKGWKKNFQVRIVDNVGYSLSTDIYLWNFYVEWYCRFHYFILLFNISIMKVWLKLYFNQMHSSNFPSMLW